MAETQECNVKTDWADNLQALMSAQGRKVGWLAEQIGMHPTQLSRIVSGDTRYRLSEQDQEAIAKALGVPARFIFGCTSQNS